MHSARSSLILSLTVGAMAMETVTIPIRKSQSRWLQRSNGHRRHLQTGSSALEGGVSQGYQAAVTVGAQTLELTIDSGSSSFAVAAARTSADCSSWYAGECTGEWITNVYGVGSWSGRVCSSAPVSIGGLSAGMPLFVGILSQQGNFLNNCNPGFSGIVENGIVGVAYASLLSDSPLRRTLIEAVAEASGVPRIFSMQCCGWNGATAGGGALVLGGTDASLHHGALSYVNVTDRSYYCVAMVSPASNGGSGNSCGAGNAIIDSGTSVIQLTSDAYQELMQPVATAMGCSVADLSGYTYAASLIGSLPNLTITFADGVSVSIPAHRYFQPQPGYGSSCYDLFVSIGDSNILGQPLMEVWNYPRSNPGLALPATSALLASWRFQSMRWLIQCSLPPHPPSVRGQTYYTVFDQESHRVGFAPIAGCPTIPLSCAAAAAVTFPPSPPPAPPTLPPSACNICAGATTASAVESACGVSGYCGWCADSQQCLPAASDGSGPAEGNCSAWVFLTSSCPALGILPPEPPTHPPRPSPPPAPATPPKPWARCGEYSGSKYSGASCDACTRDVENIAGDTCAWCPSTATCLAGVSVNACTGLVYQPKGCSPSTNRSLSWGAGVGVALAALFVASLAAALALLVYQRHAQRRRQVLLQHQAGGEPQANVQTVELGASIEATSKM